MSSHARDHEKQPSRKASSLDQLKAQVLAQTRREPAATRGEQTRKNRVLALAIVLIPLLLFLAMGGLRITARPAELIVENVVGSALFATVALALALSRGTSMLGRPRVWLVALVLLTPLALFCWRVLVSARYPLAMVEWPERPGMRCFLLSSALSVVPLVGLLVMRKNSDPVHPHLAAASLAAAVGAGAWVLVDMWCPVSYVPHLLLGHVLPLALLMFVSGLVGGRLLAVRRKAAVR